MEKNGIDPTGKTKEELIGYALLHIPELEQDNLPENLIQCKETSKSLMQNDELSKALSPLFYTAKYIDEYMNHNYSDTPEKQIISKCKNGLREIATEINDNYKKTITVQDNSQLEETPNIQNNDRDER